MLAIYLTLPSFHHYLYAVEQILIRVVYILTQVTASYTQWTAYADFDLETVAGRG